MHTLGHFFNLAKAGKDRCQDQLYFKSKHKRLGKTVESMNLRTLQQVAMLQAFMISPTIPLPVNIFIEIA
jgi:hypothetical protein